jgi:small-conductance mechanosensitive channel
LNNLTSSAAQTLGAFLPRLGGAVVLTIVGLIAARVIGRVTQSLTSRAGLDYLAERYGVDPLLSQAGVTPPLSTLLGRLVQLAIAVVVVFAAISLLGFSALSTSLNAAILYLPRVFAACALIIIGIVAAKLVREAVDRTSTQLDLGVPVGRIVELAIITVFVVTALSQLGVPTETIRLFLEAVLGAIALTIALAFGLGGGDSARQLTTGRSIQGEFSIGQRITVADVTGTINAIHASAMTLTDANGQDIRVPNHVLAQSIVVVHNHGEQPPSADT